jgi:Uma2 family endonuclease
MESYLHVMTFFLLMASLRWWWRDRTDWFAAGNLSIYYPALSPQTGRKTRKKLAFRGPDFFLVLGVEPKKQRNSWVVENEGKYPDLIVEILSKSTQKKDRGEKKAIYEKIFKTPEYILFDPDTLSLEGHRLVRGRYAPIRPDARGRLWSERLGLSFGVHGDALRLFTPDGSLVPLPEEAARGAMVQVKHEAARSKQLMLDKAQLVREKVRLAERNLRLAAKLRALGVDPKTVD